jgi:hypothetical protein
MNFSPEHQLLIDLSSEKLSREELLQSIFSENYSWDFFLQETARHSVGPLIYGYIQKQHFEDMLPPSVVQGLKKSYQQTGLQNLFLFNETKNIIEQLAQNKIDFILFKGSALSQEIYGNAALRPCSDVDMLVKRESIEDVKKIFFASGFSFPENLMHESFYYQNHFHLPFHKTLKNASVMIELHWNLMDKYLLGATSIDEIWERKRPIQFEGVPAFGLSLEDELIYLALHTLKHGYMNQFIASDPKYLPTFLAPAAENKVMWFSDLRKILEAKGSQINWTELTARADRWGVLESIQCIYILLNLLYPHLEIPKELLHPKKPIQIPLPKRLLFKTILTRSNSSFIKEHLLKMKGDLQFRPIRMFDILEYMLPRFSTLSKLYHFQSPLLALLFYPYHMIKTALLGFYGLCQWFVFSIWKIKHAGHEHHDH